MRRTAASFVLLAMMLSQHSATAQVDVLEPVPSSAVVQLLGPSRIDGNGAVSLGELAAGDYTLLLHAEGFAAARARLLRTSDGHLVVRGWSGPSAFLRPPGFAHLDREESRGWMHFGAALVSAASWLANHSALEDARARQQGARDRLEGPSPDAVADLADLRSAADEVFDRENMRDLWTAYVAATWIGAGVEAWLLTPSPRITATAEGALRAELPRIGAGRAGLSSLLVPGAGQRALGHQKRADVFGTAILASTAGAIFAQDSFLEARRSRLQAERDLTLSSGTPSEAAARASLDDARSTEDRRSTLRYAVFGTAIGLHLWNVVDAMLLGHDAASVEVGGLTARPTRDGVVFAWTRHFD